MKKLLLAAMLIATPSFAQTPAERYAGLCAGCHTPDPNALRASAFVTNGSAGDIAALIPVVRGAGGIITDWAGGPAYPATSTIAAATPELHAAALRALAPL